VSFVNRTLQPPRYGYLQGGKFYRPTRAEILRETCFRLNPSKRHNWLAVVSFSVMLVFLTAFSLFFARYFSWTLLVTAYIYGTFVMGSHANFWIHRYCTHRAFTFRNSFVRMICRNLVIKAVPEEIYVISHHVHHQISDQPGDPYNPQGGWLYCFLADFNHQSIRKDLSETEYHRLCGLMNHTGVKINSYQNYLKWGSICHPLYTLSHYLLNWMFWASVFYVIGGFPVVLAMFGITAVWAYAYRTVGFKFHGGGANRQSEGREFHRSDFSLNSLLPGWVTGEWHNNHHLYPGSARSGFLSYQLDLPFLLIRLLAFVGCITSYRDCKKLFMETHWLPYKNALQKGTKRPVELNKAAR
jgi:fatty-acid desaturase